VIISFTAVTIFTFLYFMWSYRPICIGVASYGALGHVPLSTSNCLFFGLLQSRTNSDIRLLW